MKKVIIIILCLLSFILYKQVIAYWVGGEVEKPETNLIEINKELILDAEINRLSKKYNVSSSTVRAVAKCESQLYGSAINYNRLPDGTVWSTDKGYLQINDYYHKDTMKRLGLDWNDEWDSLEYGIMMMSEQGLSPWKASAQCWRSLI